MKLPSIALLMGGLAGWTHSAETPESPVKVEVDSPARLQPSAAVDPQGSALPATGNLPPPSPFGEPYATNRSPSTVNMQFCPRSMWEIGRDQWGEIVRVNLLKINDLDWEQVSGVKKVWRMRGCEDKPGMVFHPVMSEIKDVDGDGTPDIFHLRSPGAGARIERLRYQDGAVVWESEPVGEMSGDESRLAVFGLNRADDWCVFYADQGGAYCLDAATGKTRWKQSDVRGDAKDSAYTVGHFLNREQSAMVIHANGVITCLEAAGKSAWTYDTGLRNGDAYGHEVLCADADGDGLDEIFVVVQKRALALRGDGTLLWQDRKQARHSDYLWCGDVDGDGRKEFVYDHEGCGGRGPAQVADALTGQIKLKIDYRAAGVGHAQNLAVGNFDKDRPGLEIALCDKRDGLAVWAANGELLWQRKVPTSLLSQGDWDGDGADDIMVFGLGANVDGIFSVWNGKGERLYAITFLPSPSQVFGDRSRSHAMPGGHEGVRRQVDLDGNGKADVIMPFGTWNHGSDSILFLMEKTTPRAAADKNPRPQADAGGITPAEKPDIPAFPGAEGFAKFTKGGRGGDVFIVTNLHDDGPGSLRLGIESGNGPRTIVFGVGGTIALKRPLEISDRAYLTIAGQTAPGKGITLRDQCFSIQRGKHIVVRYLRVRLGDGNKEKGDPDTMTVDSNDQVILDHLSLSWGIDGNSDYRDNSNMTLQWLIYSEALNRSLHGKGEHAMCTSLRDCRGNTTLHHNIYSTSRDRHPTVGSGSGAKGFADVVVDYRNCVDYNWTGDCFNPLGGMKINVVNNYFKPGPCSNTRGLPLWLKDGDTSGARGYLSGNCFEAMPDLYNKDNYSAVLYASRWKYAATDRQRWVSAEPHGAAGLIPATQPARDAFKTCLQYSGCSLVRDTVDERVIDNIVKGQGSVIDSQDQVGGWDPYPEIHRPDGWDTDGDGMPDAWEKSHGLDPDDPSDRNHDTAGAGYTNLEEYLNSLVPDMTQLVTNREKNE